MRRLFAITSLCASLATACGGSAEGISSRTEVAQAIAELTLLAYEVRLVGIDGDIVDGVVTVPCPQGGTIAATLLPVAAGRHRATFTGCSHGENVFDGTLLVILDESGGAYTLTISGELAASGHREVSFIFTDFSEVVTFAGASRSFTMVLSGRVETRDAAGVRSWDFAGESYAYDESTGKVAPI
jgi:hypothetical protein